jgi:hypothetical protein
MEMVSFIGCHVVLTNPAFYDLLQALRKTTSYESRDSDVYFVISLCYHPLHKKP